MPASPAVSHPLSALALLFRPVSLPVPWATSPWSFRPTWSSSVHPVTSAQPCHLSFTDSSSEIPYPKLLIRSVYQTPHSVNSDLSFETWNHNGGFLTYAISSGKSKSCERQEGGGGRREEGGGRPLLIFAVFSDLQHRVWYTGQKWPL